MIRRTHRIATTALALSLTLGLTHATWAGPVEQYEAGVRLFQNGKYDAAVTELEASMKARPNSNTALYLGNAYLKLGKLDNAKDSFESALRLDPNSTKRTSIETLIRSIDARTEVTVHVESNPPGAKISIDDSTEGVGTTPADINVLVGRRRIVLSKEGYGPTTRELTLVARAPQNLKVDLDGKGCEMALSSNGTAGGNVSLDGKPPVALPVTMMVPAGEHKLKFGGAGYVPKEEVVKCDGFKAGALSVPLELEKGRLTIPNAPGTVVMIDGKIVALSADDATNGIGLTPGRHEVTVTVGDQQPRTSVVEVRPGEAVSVGTDKPEDGAYGSRSLYLELMGGGNLALRDWKLGSNAFRSQNGGGITPKSSGMVGLRVGLQISPRFAAEVEVAWIALPNALDTSHGLVYDANLVYHLMPTRWTPVLEAGVGAYQVISGSLGTDVAPRGHLGVGVRGKVTRWFAVRADVRDVVSKGFEAPGSNNLELLAGAELSF